VDSTKIIFDCPLPPWLVGLLGVGVLVAVIFFVRRDGAHLGAARRRIILAGAVVATLMLIALALNPKLIRTWPDLRRPICSILVDASRSMLFSDKYKGSDGQWLAERMPGLNNVSLPIEAPRAEVARTLLSRVPKGWLAKVSEEFDVSAWRFASELEPLALDETASGYEVLAQGYATAMGKALEESSAGLRGTPPGHCTAQRWGLEYRARSIGGSQGLGAVGNTCLRCGFGRP